MVSGTHPMDWHDRETGQMAFRGRLDCSPTFEAFLAGTVADLSHRVRDARGARELLLGGDTIIGSDARAAVGNAAAMAGPVATPPSASALFAPAGTVPPIVTPPMPMPTTPAPVAPSGSGALPASHVAAAPASSTRRLVFGATAVAAIVAAWLLLDGRDSTSPAGGNTAGTNASAAPSAGPSAAAAAPEAFTECVQPSTIVHRTESQFDLHLLCPAGWRAAFVTPVRSSRVGTPEGTTEVWAGVWRPARDRETVDAFVERWLTTMTPQLGALTLRVVERPDNAMVRMAVVAAAAGRERRGDLKVESVEAGGNRYLTWSLLLEADQRNRPMALQVLGSLDYLAPTALPAPEGAPGRNLENGTPKERDEN
jgi:hypothetical protein